MSHRPSSAALCEAESHWDWSPPLKPLARFDVSNDEAFVNTYCEAYQEEVVVRAQTTWPKDGSAEETWSVIKSALTEAAGSVLGNESRCWFRVSESILQPALHR